MTNRTASPHAEGFSLPEALVALVVFLLVMATVFTFFVDLGKNANTQSGALDQATTARVAIDEVARTIQQLGYNIDRAPSDDPSTWQLDVAFAGSHAFAFNADLDQNIGPIPPSVTVNFPGGSYAGQGPAGVTGGAETYVYTIDANDDGVLDVNDRTNAASGSYNPAADTPDPQDFALFKKIYGYNGTNYGGTLVPITAGLFTNAITQAVYPDGSKPPPLFEYWLTEDVDRSRTLANQECAVGTCPPSTTRLPKLYLWGDTNGDGVLSTAEADFITDKPVGSPLWSKNPFVTSGVYNSSATTAAFSPVAAYPYILTVANAAKFSSGMYIQIDSGADKEYAVIDNAIASNNTVTVSADLHKAHAVGVTVQIMPQTLLRCIRAVKIQFDAIAPVADSIAGVQAAGRAGRAGTRGMDYKVIPYDRTVQLVNMTSDPLVTATSAATFCPLFTHGWCAGSDASTVRAYFPSSAPTPLNFFVQDTSDAPVSGVSLSFTKTSSPGTLSASTGVSNSQGMAATGYTATDVGDATVTASGTCVDQYFNTITYTDTIVVKGTKLVATMTNDCLSTVSSRTSAPSASFTVQATDSGGAVPNSPVSLSLQFDPAYLPASPNFSNLQATLAIGGSTVGTTDSTGAFPAWSGTTGGSGTISGTVVLNRDTVGNGAKVNLIVSASGDTCWPASGNLAKGVTYLKLNLASSNPTGCTETSPCLIAAGAQAPNVIGTLSVNGTPIQNATVNFTKTDLHPSPDSPTAASIFAPSASVTTDSTGAGMVYVTNNGSASITPANPLLTTVDATTLGEGYCTSPSVMAASARPQFLYAGSAPAGKCDADMQQAWVNGNKQLVCMHVLDPSVSGACPLRPTGIKFAVWNAAGSALDSTQVIVKITGGRSTASNTDCTKTAPPDVVLFQTSCNGGANLANNTQWNFGTGGCPMPSAANPGNYFALDEIQWKNDIGTSNRRVDVTLYYGCDNLCSTQSGVSETWTLHADH